MARAHPSRSTGRTHQRGIREEEAPSKDHDPRHLPSFKSVEVTLGRLGSTATLPFGVGLQPKSIRPLLQSSVSVATSHKHRGILATPTAMEQAAEPDTRSDTDKAILDEQGDRKGEAQTQACGAA